MEPKLVEEKILCRGRRFALAQRVIEYQGERTVKDILLHPGAVVILPLLDNEKIIILRQYRPGPLEWVYELPAGTIEEGEDPTQTARRELVEETGYEPGNLQLLFKTYPSPGTTTETMYMYLATNLKYVGPRPEKGEIIETKIVTLNQALEMIKKGEIVDGKTIMLILYYTQFIKQKP